MISIAPGIQTKRWLQRLAFAAASLVVVGCGEKAAQSPSAPPKSKPDLKELHETPELKKPIWEDFQPVDRVEDSFTTRVA